MHDSKSDGIPEDITFEEGSLSVASAKPVLNTAKDASSSSSSSILAEERIHDDESNTREDDSPRTQAEKSTKERKSMAGSIKVVGFRHEEERKCGDAYSRAPSTTKAAKASSVKLISLRKHSPASLKDSQTSHQSVTSTRMGKAATKNGGMKLIGYRPESSRTLKSETQPQVAKGVVKKKEEDKLSHRSVTSTRSSKSSNKNGGLKLFGYRPESSRSLKSEKSQQDKNNHTSRPSNKSTRSGSASVSCRKESLRKRGSKKEQDDKSVSSKRSQVSQGAVSVASEKAGFWSTYTEFPRRLFKEGKIAFPAYVAHTIVNDVVDTIEFLSPEEEDKTFADEDTITPVQSETVDGATQDEQGRTMLPEGVLNKSDVMALVGFVSFNNGTEQDQGERCVEEEAFEIALAPSGESDAFF